MPSDEPGALPALSPLTPAEWALERYKAARGQIEHESALIGVRLGWLLAAEAFLVAAYATVLTVGAAGSEIPHQFVSKAKQLYWALPVAGIFLTALVGGTIWGALRAMDQVRKFYVDQNNPSLGLPPITVTGHIYFPVLFALYLVPALTIVGWVYLLCTVRL